MARAVERLSARAAQTAKASGKVRMIADGRGLYLRVEVSGSKSWIFRYQASGRRHDHGLGPYPDITLAAARERAQQCRRMLVNGIDPVESRKAERQSAHLSAAKTMTFKQCADRYLAAHSVGWRSSKHGAQWAASMPPMSM
jgi:Arm DNA-binding domain